MLVDEEAVEVGVDVEDAVVEVEEEMEDVESLIITVVHRIRISRGMKVQMDKMGLRKIRSNNMAILRYESLLKCYPCNIIACLSFRKKKDN